MYLGILLSLLTALPNAQGGSDEVPLSIRPAALRAHMRFLADDMLEGRGTATRGHEIAARYVASQLEALGLRPAGVDGSYYQRVPLRRAELLTDRTSLVLDLPAGRRKLVLGKDYVAFKDPDRIAWEFYMA